MDECRFKSGEANFVSFLGYKNTSTLPTSPRWEVGLFPYITTPWFHGFEQQLAHSFWIKNWIWEWLPWVASNLGSLRSLKSPEGPRLGYSCESKFVQTWPYGCVDNLSKPMVWQKPTVPRASESRDGKVFDVLTLVTPMLLGLQGPMVPRGHVHPVSE